MRNISNAGLAKLKTMYGVEPICIVEVDWYNSNYAIGPDGELIPTGVPFTKTYADRDIPATSGNSLIPGKIVDLGALDEVVDMVLGNGSSSAIEITLDDTDGSIKALYNDYDFHKQDVRVYQWFNGLDYSDRFLLFAGKINSPVTWNERDRTIKFSVVSQLEAEEVGFSPEQGQFGWLPAEMCGKAWPMIFGTTQDVPATRITRICEAVTITPVGIASGSDAAIAAPLYADQATSDTQATISIMLANIQATMALNTSLAWAFAGLPGMGQDPTAIGKANKALQQYAQFRQQALNLQNKVHAKEECITLSRHDAIDYVATNGIGPIPIQTLGGEDFPQNTPIWVNIGGGSFYGYFQGNLFYCDAANRVNIDDAVQLATDLYTFQEGQNCPKAGVTQTIGKFDFTQQVPFTSALSGATNESAVGLPSVALSQGFKGFAPPGKWWWYGYYVNHPSGINVPGIGFGQLPPASTWLRIFWKEGGQTVTLETAEPVSYIASIVPGTVLCVKAFKQYDGPHVLTTVPTDFYTVSTVQYGAITAVQITFERELKTYRYTDGTNQGWSDEIYVTFQSTVGPNTVDIMAYLIENYTDLDWDSDSFNYCWQKLQAFPSNFALLEVKDVLSVLKDIAFQCRCASGWKTTCST